MWNNQKQQKELILKLAMPQPLAHHQGPFSVTWIKFNSSMDK